MVNGNTLAYDAEGRQVSVTEPAALGGGTESYLYDGGGQRVEKTGPGGSTVYVYDARGELAAEYSTNWAAAPCTTCYLTWDHLGTVRLVTDQNANVIARHDYLPFGEEIAGGTAGRSLLWGPQRDTVKQKFTGKARDSESGLDYFGARYYGSALGRFTSPDWSSAPQPVPYANLGNPQTLNLYAYVANNPLSRSDLDGHNWWDKLKNLFGDAGCWCEGEKAESAALRNLYAEQRRQQEEVRQWRIAMKNPAYHIAMAMAMGQMGPAGEELEAAAAESAAAEEAAEEEAGQVAAAEGKAYAETAEADSVVAANGTRINGFTTHGVNRAIGDTAERAGTRPEAILDALRNPTKIKSGIDSQGRPYEIFTGKDARVVVNPTTGNVVSVNPLSGAGAH